MGMGMDGTSSWSLRHDLAVRDEYLMGHRLRRSSHPACVHASSLLSHHNPHPTRLSLPFIRSSTPDYNAALSCVSLRPPRCRRRQRPAAADQHSVRWLFFLPFSPIRTRRENRTFTDVGLGMVRFFVGRR